MLNALRTGSKSFLVKGLLFGMLLLAMLGLAVMDVQGMFRSGISNTTVAKIGREKISTVEFSRMVQSELQRMRMPETQAYMQGIPQQILTREISNRVFSKAAQDMGLVVSDAEAAKKIKAMLNPLVQQGLTEKEALQNVLRTYGLTERSLVSSIKSQIATESLLRAISSGVAVPQQLVQDALKYRYEWRRAEYFQLNASDAGKLPEPSEEELKKHYEMISNRFMVPENRTFTYVVLDSKAAGESAKVTEDDLKAAYQDRIKDYSLPETRTISQLVVSDEALARKIYEQASATKDLKKSAAIDPKAKVVTDTYTENDLQVELAPVAFKATAGSVLEPVKTGLGWHVLYIEKIVPGSVKPFESVRAELEKELATDKAGEQLYERANEIDDLIASGKPLGEVATQFGLKETLVEKIESSAENKSIPAWDKVKRAVFSLGKNEASQMIETPEGSFIVAEVRDISPAQERPLAEVRAQVLKSWQDEQRMAALDKLAAKTLERLNLGESFDKVARELGKTVTSTKLLKRDEKTDLPRGLIPALFSVDKVGQATTTSGENSVIVLRLAERQIDLPKEQNKEDVEALEAVLSRALQNDILEQYRLGLLAKYDVEINNEVVEKMYAPKLEDLIQQQ